MKFENQVVAPPVTRPDDIPRTKVVYYVIAHGNLHEMSAGTPTLSFSSGHPADRVQPDKTGRLIEVVLPRHTNGRWTNLLGRMRSERIRDKPRLDTSIGLFSRPANCAELLLAKF